MYISSEKMTRVSITCNVGADCPHDHAKVIICESQIFVWHMKAGKSQIGPFSCKKPSKLEHPGPPVYIVSESIRCTQYLPKNIPLVQNVKSFVSSTLLAGQNLVDTYVV